MRIISGDVSPPMLIGSARTASDLVLVVLEEELCDRGAVEVAHMLEPTEIVNLDKGLTLTFEGMKEGGWGLREVVVGYSDASASKKSCRYELILYCLQRLYSFLKDKRNMKSNKKSSIRISGDIHQINFSPDFKGTYYEKRYLPLLAVDFLP